VYCPLCKAEYRAGFDRCSDCLVGLVSTLEQPKAANVVTPMQKGQSGITVRRNTVKIALAVAVLGVIVFGSLDRDNLTKLFALILAALEAIFHSTFFWFCVAGAFVSWWFSWIVRDAVKDAIKQLNLDERVREAVREAIEEAKEEREEIDD